MYFNDYYSITDDENYPSNLFLKGYKYNEWYKNDEEKSKSQLEENIAEGVKQEKKNIKRIR